MEYMFNVVWTDTEDSVVVSANGLNEAWGAAVDEARGHAGETGSQIVSIVYVNSSADI